MRNLVCFRHHGYDGSEPPVLSCKTCCKIYIDMIRGEQKSSDEKIREEKSRREQSKKKGLASNDK